MTTTLLAVDDSVTMRKVLEITFAGENYKTVIASSAAEALNLAKSERPLLALLDHTFADTSGYDLCRELKAAVPGLAVVILSSKQTPFDKARAAATGVDDFMDKPFDTQKLLDKVSQVLAAPRAVVGAAAAAQPVASAPPTPSALPSVGARPRSQTLAYGASTSGPPAVAPAPPQAAPARTLVGTPAATPRPATVQPVAPASRSLSQPTHHAAAPQAAVKQAAAVVVGAVGNGQLSGKLQALGLTEAQVEAVLALSREVVERVVWEVVPVLAETLIKEEIQRLTAG